MIYFTLRYGPEGSSIAINPDCVVSVVEATPSGSGSTIYLTNGRAEYVTEDMLTVVGELIAARKG